MISSHWAIIELPISLQMSVNISASLFTRKLFPNNLMGQTSIPLRLTLEILVQITKEISLLDFY